VSQPERAIEELSAEARANHIASSNASFEWRQRAYPRSVVGVAEGDSWFDYVPAWFEDPVKGDLIGHLHATRRYNIFRVAAAGDTLENMVWGTEYAEASWTPRTPQLEQTLHEIERKQPQIFLFSGGGNDFAGSELEGLLNHAESGLPALREAHAEYVFGEVVPRAIETLIGRVHAAKRDLHVFLHGYAYAIPDGRGVIRITPGWQFYGPWLRPAFTKKRILELAEMQAILRGLVDRFNAALAAVARRHARVHYIDLRPVITERHWANELHPTARGFGLVADAFDAAIQASLRGGGSPRKRRSRS
jgi:hypothetical protein